MSATRDKTQKVAFVYSNLYQIYRKGKETAVNSAAAQPESVIKPNATSGAVLKTDDLHKNNFAHIREHVPVNLLHAQNRIVKKPEAVRATDSYQADAIKSLKTNLDQLNNLHARLRFMLKELEELVKE